MREYLVRFGSNSNWTRFKLDDDDVKFLKEAGYHVLPI